MSGVKASHVVLPVIAVDAQVSRCEGIYGTAWLARPGLIVTCSHCIPVELPDGQRVAVTRKNSLGGFDVRVLEDIGRDARGHDLATARADFDVDDQAWPLYAGHAKAGMPVWSFGYPLPDTVDEPGGMKSYRMFPRFLRGYVTRRFVGYPATHPKAELDMPCPPGLSGAPIVFDTTDEVVGLVYGRTTVQVPDELPAPLYHFGLAYDREVLDGLAGPATNGQPLATLVT